MASMSSWSLGCQTQCMSITAIYGRHWLFDQCAASHCVMHHAMKYWTSIFLDLLGVGAMNANLVFQTWCRDLSDGRHSIWKKIITRATFKLIYFDSSQTSVLISLLPNVVFVLLHLHLGHEQLTCICPAIDSGKTTVYTAGQRKERSASALCTARLVKVNFHVRPRDCFVHCHVMHIFAHLWWFVTFFFTEWVYMNGHYFLFLPFCYSCEVWNVILPTFHGRFASKLSFFKLCGLYSFQKCMQCFFQFLVVFELCWI